jgi:bifunctional non-homologous end joining protein LigD
VRQGGPAFGAARRPMKLDVYRKKRDEERTNEPFGGELGDGGGPTWNGAFVVHLHDATRKHYDLRLERGGVLLSFAVPHGPSVDPSEKHLAIQTEDHPVEYLDFEAVIPDGNYGAGPMIVWDRGRVTYREVSAEDGLTRGKLDFDLQGYKLRGRFALVRTKRDPKEWLLFKKEDSFASRTRDVAASEPRSVLSGLTVEELLHASQIQGELEARARNLPGARPGRPDGSKIVPMLCAASGAKLENKEFLYELKLDGMRALGQKDGPKVALTNRKLRDYTAIYPEITRAIAALPARRVVLDGEVVAFDAAGKPNFQRLAQRIHLTRGHEIRLQMIETPVVFMVFDLLAFGDTDLMEVPLAQRKALLGGLLHGAGVLRRLDHLEGNGQPLLDFCRANKLEGLVAKRMTSRYEPGPRRGGDWIKVKCERDEEFVVVGLNRGEGNRQALGALDLASYEDGKLVHRGKVGSGLDDKTIAILLERLPPLVVPEKQAEGPYLPSPNGRLHLKPEVVVSVRFLGFSADGHTRFPVFRGIRDDVSPRDCTAGPKSGEALEGAAHPPPSGGAPPRPEPPRKVHVTNRTKVLFPEDGYTKGELCGYYEAIAPALLPYLKDRPVALVRYPDGIHGKNFYQWNVPLGVPSWVKTAHMPHDDGQDRQVFLINDVETLLVVANLAAIPIHILGSRTSAREECEFFTVDLDVELATFGDGVVLARTLKIMLDGLGLPSFLKTSGQQGLHVLAPLGPGVPYEAARMLTELVGRLLVQRHPDRATMERVIARRGPRVFVDTGQTGRSRTIVAPWSVRARPGAPVSMPLLWEELTETLDPRVFNIKTAPARRDAVGDPMAGLLTERPDVAAAIARLQTEVAKASAGK